MSRNYSYEEIANDFGLWCEYVDPDEDTTEDEFNEWTVEEKIEMQIKCFGQEEKYEE